MFFLGIADCRSSITQFFIKYMNRRWSLFVCCMRTWMHLKGFWNKGSYVFVEETGNRKPENLKTGVRSMFDLAHQ